MKLERRTHEEMVSIWLEQHKDSFFALSADGNKVIDLNYKPPPPPPAPKHDFLIIQSEAIHVRMSDILTVVCQHFNVSLNDLRSVRRKRQWVLARQAAFYLGRKYTSHSFPYIGRILGKRDHTTVVHGCARVERDKGKYQPALSNCIADLHKLKQQPIIPRTADGSAQAVPANTPVPAGTATPGGER